VRLTILVLAALILSSGAGALAYFFPVLAAGVGQTGQKVNVPLVPGLKATATPVAAPGAPFTVLLLGSDDDSKFSADHVLTQSMILTRIDPATKHVTMLSIPRDTLAAIPGHGSNKVNSAFQLGGPDLAQKTIEDLLGIRINSYALINFEAVHEDRRFGRRRAHRRQAPDPRRGLPDR